MTNRTNEIIPLIRRGDPIGRTQHKRTPSNKEQDNRRGAPQPWQSNTSPAQRSARKIATQEEISSVSRMTPALTKSSVTAFVTIPRLQMLLRVLDHHAQGSWISRQAAPFNSTGTSQAFSIQATSPSLLFQVCTPVMKTSPETQTPINQRKSLPACNGEQLA